VTITAGSLLSMYFKQPSTIYWHASYTHPALIFSTSKQH